MKARMVALAIGALLVVGCLDKPGIRRESQPRSELKQASQPQSMAPDHASSDTPHEGSRPASDPKGEVDSSDRAEGGGRDSPGADVDECSRDPRIVATFEPARPRQVDQGRAALERAVRLADKGDHASAVGAYEEALRFDQELALAHLGLAESLLHTESDFSKMRQHLAYALVLLPSSARAHDRYATVVDELGLRDIAERHWLCAIALRSNFTEARLHLAQHYLRGEHGQSEDQDDDRADEAARADKAEAQLRDVLRAEPRNTQAVVLLASVLEHKGASLEAGRTVAALAEHVGQSAALYRRAAELLQRGGDPTAALRLRRAADRLDPPAKGRAMRPLKPPGRQPRPDRAKGARPKT